MRTQKDAVATKHLSKQSFDFLETARNFRENLDEKKMQEMIANRDYEELERFIIQNLIG